MKANIKTQFMPSYQGLPGKKFTQESKTVPDMSLTVRELLINHSRGINSNMISMHGEYFETEIPVLRDLVDAKEYKDELARKAKEADKDYKKLQEKVKDYNLQKAKEQLKSEALKEEQDSVNSKPPKSDKSS